MRYYPGDDMEYVIERLERMLGRKQRKEPTSTALNKRMSKLLQELDEVAQLVRDRDKKAKEEFEAAEKKKKEKEGEKKGGPIMGNLAIFWLLSMGLGVSWGWLFALYFAK